MNKNQAASQNFFLSPFLTYNGDPSPYLNHFPIPFRKQSEAFDDLIDFKLEENPRDSVEEAEQSQFHIQQERLILEGDNFCVRLGEDMQKFQEAASQNHSHHCEIPSTKFLSIKEQHQPPFFLLRASQEGTSQIEAIINFLVEHSQLNEELLDNQSGHFCQNNPTMKQVFNILVKKFKKLHKTKEQMTKYCMRKAFKFIADRTKKDKPHTRDLQNCMRQYFSQSTSTANLTIPFKKHSVEKTMNGTFIKRVFSCNQFLQDYQIFIKEFQAMIAQDNQKKIKYLGKMIEQAIEKGNVQSIEKIKRLPWTSQILRQVQDLAISMPEYPQRILAKNNLED